MRVVFIGCGFVSTFYGDTIANHPQLELVGVFDRLGEHADAFASHYRVRSYPSFAEVLADPSVDAIVNLTNPESHFEISAAALEAGKHVYSEKPLATDFTQASDLVKLAKQRGLQLCCAPCNVLGETAHTLWKAVDQGKIGEVRLVYAEMDDGMIHKMGCERWVNALGRPWPFRDEFQVGCTLEHAAYYVSWLVALFGSVTELQAFPAVLIPEKKMGAPISPMAPDYSVASLRFETGVVARLTCSVVAPHDHRLRIFGDEGTLSTQDCWFYRSPVEFEPFSNLSVRKRSIPLYARFKGVQTRRLPLIQGPNAKHRYRTRGHQMDFARGIAEMADSAKDGRESRLGADFSLHINEVVLKIQTPDPSVSTQAMVTRASRMAPMPWAGFELATARRPATSDA